VSVQHDGVVAYHAQTPFDAKYARYREDVAADFAYLGRKWSRGGHFETPGGRA